MSATAAGLFGTTSVTTTPVSDFKANSRFKSGVRSCTSTPNEVLLLWGGGVAAGGGDAWVVSSGSFFVFNERRIFLPLRQNPRFNWSPPFFFWISFWSSLAEVALT